MEEKNNKQMDVELVQKNETPKNSISSLINVTGEASNFKKTCYFWGAIIASTASIILLVIGSIMCANAFRDQTSFGINNIKLEKGLSIVIILSGIGAMIFAITCMVLYKKLAQQNNISVGQEKSYGTLDKNYKHYDKTLNL